MKRLRLPRS
uniref:Uncharacterized protein n=1 Tax=Anguilla anguilla TaxID=7936 RepID=A0A0E9QL23_ANGAN